MSGDLLPFLSLAWPLVLACAAALPPVRRHAMRLLPLAPLPALWVGLARQHGETVLPDLLLGSRLGVEPAGALLLALTAALWTAAGVYAQAYMADTRKPAVFAGFWCLTLAGNLGVFMAADVITFYVAFAVVSLAAYVLVVHEGTEAALRAGRVYIAMVVVGEVCLLAAFVIGIAAADSLSIGDIREALPGARLGGLAVVLLIVGFGIKAGLMPLHVWLPLAHPAAPTPASAVLSGAIVKAGIIGLILFVPGGTGTGAWLVALGFLGAFAGALLAVTQADPKAILAYSTISQMGVVIALIGAALPGGDGDAKAAFYAFHHGLAKGALFLSVGLVAASAGRWRAVLLGYVALVALSIAGAPVTGGGLSKLAAKSGLDGIAETALTVSAVTTTLALAWFIVRLTRMPSRSGRDRPDPLLVLPTLAVGIGALVTPWLLWPAWSGLPSDYPLHLSSLWSASWPVLAGLALFVAAATLGLAPPKLPEGDLLAALRPGPVLKSVARRLVAPNTAATAVSTRLLAARAALHWATSATRALERRLRQPGIGGIVLAALAGALALSCVQ